MTRTRILAALALLSLAPAPTFAAHLAPPGRAHRRLHRARDPRDRRRALGRRLGTGPRGAAGLLGKGGRLMERLTFEGPYRTYIKYSGPSLRPEQRAALEALAEKLNEAAEPDVSDPVDDDDDD